MYLKDKYNLIINKYNIGGSLDNNLDFNKIAIDQNIKYIIIKNFEIDEHIISFINSFNEIDKIKFSECDFIVKTQINCNKVELFRCNNIRLYNFNNYNEINIEGCDFIDLSKINNNIEVLKIINTKTENLNNISDFNELIIVYLEDIDINEKIEYFKLKKLKKLNLNGSKVLDRDKYIEELNKLKINYTFMKENKNVG